jgi:hypothetical protein
MRLENRIFFAIFSGFPERLNQLGFLGSNKNYYASLKRKGGGTMTSAIKHYLVISLFVIPLMGVFQSPALGIQIDAIDDAGQEAGQIAYVKFVVDPSGVTLTTITTAEVSNRWTSALEVKTFAGNNDLLKDKGWFLQSAGNIWSPDNDFIVGDPFTAPHAGVYRISAVDGAFQYDSFIWSPVAGKYLWQLQIYDPVGGANYTLGSDARYDTKDLALGANLGKYMDIALAEGGELIFWIADGSLDGAPSERNTIDNSGFLKFDVTEIPTPIPEPSTLILTGTGLFFLVRRFRRSLIPLN